MDRGARPPHKTRKTVAFLSALWYPKRHVYIHRSATSPEKVGQVSKQSGRIGNPPTPYLSPTPSTHYYYSQMIVSHNPNETAPTRPVRRGARRGIISRSWGLSLPIISIGGGGLSPTFFLFTRRGRGGRFYVSFPGGFFFILLRKLLLFCFINLTALINILTYLPYLIFKITVVKRFCLPPPRSCVIQCGLFWDVRPRKIRRKADQGNISMCRERDLFSCSSVSLSLFSYDSFAPRVFLVSIPNSLYVPLNPDWMPHPYRYGLFYASGKR